MSNRKASIRAALIDLLADATAPDKQVTRDELKAAGIPQRWRGGIVNASRRITSDSDAVLVADDYAEMIATHDDDLNAMTTDMILKKVPRL